MKHKNDAVRMSNTGQITRILQQMRPGDDHARDALISAVYQELRAMAAGKLNREYEHRSLDVTGLVHEAYLRMGSEQSFESRRHFFGAASEAMRRILIDRSRDRKALKRGGDHHRVELDGERLAEMEVSTFKDERLLSLDEAIERFEVYAPKQAELVKLKYFAGLTIREAAEVLGVSTATGERYWAFAKSWLQSEVQRILEN
ncbi:MAG: ECF-type sigma factor [Planctomycetota bacterium]